MGRGGGLGVCGGGGGLVRVQFSSLSTLLFISLLRNNV